MEKTLNTIRHLFHQAASFVAREFKNKSYSTLTDQVRACIENFLKSDFSREERWIPPSELLELIAGRLMTSYYSHRRVLVEVTTTDLPFGFQVNDNDDGFVGALQRAVEIFVLDHPGQSYVVLPEDAIKLLVYYPEHVAPHGYPELRKFLEEIR